MKVIVYSREHNGFWKKDYKGYTQNPLEAGVFYSNQLIKDYPNDMSFNRDGEDYMIPTREIDEIMDIYKTICDDVDKITDVEGELIVKFLVE